MIEEGIGNVLIVSTWKNLVQNIVPGYAELVLLGSHARGGCLPNTLWVHLSAQLCSAI